MRQAENGTEHVSNSTSLSESAGNTPGVFRSISFGVQASRPPRSQQWACRAAVQRNACVPPVKDVCAPNPSRRGSLLPAPSPLLEYLEIIHPFAIHAALGDGPKPRDGVRPGKRRRTSSPVRAFGGGPGFVQDLLRFQAWWKSTPSNKMYICHA